MLSNGGEYLALQDQQLSLGQVGLPEVVGDRLPELGVAVIDAVVAIVAATVVNVVAVA